MINFKNAAKTAVFGLFAISMSIGLAACGGKTTTVMNPEKGLELDSDIPIPLIGKPQVDEKKPTWVKKSGNKPVEIEIELKHNGEKVDVQEDIKYITGNIDPARSTKINTVFKTQGVFGRTTLKPNEQLQAEADLRIMTDHGMLEKTTELNVRVSPDGKSVMVSGVAQPSAAISKLSQGYEVEFRPNGKQPDGDIFVSPQKFR